MLCRSCKRLPPLWELHHYPYLTFGDLKRSAAGGCAFCSLLWMQIQSYSQYVPTENHTLYLSIFAQCNSVYLFMYSVQENASWQLELFRDPSSRSSTQQTPHQHIVTKVYSGSHQSDATFKFLRAALVYCAKKHDVGVCTPNDNAVLPTLVLDVVKTGDKASVVLVSNDDGSKRGRYLTLSYCWGPAQVHESSQLIKARLSSYKKRGISVASLPQTLQDAVWTARRLGIRYLWIDSLCIVQDDEALRQQQLGQMARIYMQSFATILAAIPSSAAEGFLGHRRQPAGGAPPVRMAFERDAATKQTSFVLAQAIGYKKSATDARAWIFQETVLSTRLISFNAFSVEVLCRSETVTEDGLFWNGSLGPSDYCRLRPDLYVSTALRTQLSRRSVPNNQSVAPRSFKIETLEAWYRTLFDYSCRHYTNGDDRLCALAAYAEEAHKVIGGDYLAGLWSTDVVRGLQWKPVSNLFFDSNADKKYRAPSWSWAAYDGEVWYYEGFNERHGIKDTATKFPPVDDWNPTVIEAWVSMTTTDSRASTDISPSPYGPCRAGQIVLDARVGLVFAGRTAWKLGRYMHQSEGPELDAACTAGRQDVCVGFPDTAAGIPCGRVLYAAFLTFGFGLLLVEAGGGGGGDGGGRGDGGDGKHAKEKQFRRIGHIWCMMETPSAEIWRNSCTRKRITLV